MKKGFMVQFAPVNSTHRNYQALFSEVFFETWDQAEQYASSIDLSAVDFETNSKPLLIVKAEVNENSELEAPLDVIEPIIENNKVIDWL